jgi:hypothetical protein
MDINPDVIGVTDTEPGERWRQMKNYDNGKNRFDSTWYISSLGRTWDSETETSLPSFDDGIHTKFQCKYHNGSPNKTYAFPIHLMMGGVFLPSIPGKSYTFHIDFNYRNNNLNNLEKCSNAEYNCSLPGSKEYKGISKAKQDAETPQHKRYYVVEVNKTKHNCQFLQQAMNCYDQCAYAKYPRHAFLHCKYRKTDKSFLNDPSLRFCFCEDNCYFEEVLKLPRARKVYF